MIFKGCAPRIHNQSLSYPTYPRRVPKDGEIDFNRSAIDVYNYVRALTKPYPGAYYYYQNKKFILWKVAILFDELDASNGDFLISTLDCKIKVLEFEVQ